MEIGQRWLAEEMGCDPKTAGKVISELDDMGFVVRERAGRMRGPRRLRVAVYRLTWQKDNEGGPATCDFRTWLPSLP